MLYGKRHREVEEAESVFLLSAPPCEFVVDKIAHEPRVVPMARDLHAAGPFKRFFVVGVVHVGETCARRMSVRGNPPFLVAEGEAVAHEKAVGMGKGAVAQAGVSSRAEKRETPAGEPV